MFKIREQLISMFDRYKDEYKQYNTISDDDIKLNLEYFRGVFVSFTDFGAGDKMNG
ncbi:MAG: hypothetical protein LBK94_10315 [Prevotellaceae bacterium]|nr:hypothetical protein [Prevotellaceae bacterium]